MHLSELLYEGIITASAPLVSAGLALHPRGKINLMQRFGMHMNLPPQVEFWGHGASAGEVKGLIPILEKLAPPEQSFITTTSPTGLSRLTSIKGSLLPFDSRVFLRKALNQIHPKALLIGESDIWPVLINELFKRNCKIILVNGRITEKTFRRFKTFKIFKRALQKISLCCTEDNRSAERLLQLGVPVDRVLVTGNAKYDATIPHHSSSVRNSLISDFNLLHEKVITIGSIRPGEEEILFPAIAKQLSSYSFIIAPRHKERFEWFRKRLQEHNLPFEAYSNHNRPKANILLLDMFGKLEDAYAISHGAIIGGTFIEAIGGHNPLEAAAYGIPTAVGAHHEKIKPLIGNGELIPILHSSDEVSAFLTLIHESHMKEELGKKSKSVWELQQGVAEKTASAVRKVL